jgi:pyruvate/2-oxoglutarate/acetoin dehydrogenase E1 component
MGAYYSRLCDAMTILALEQRSIFLGQAVAYPGTGMSKSFEHVPKAKLLELPVAEEMQMGMSIGLSLAGALPITVYPRWNFLLLAANQLVNHLDAIPRYSDFRPKVIIRVASCPTVPLDPGPQHIGDYSDAFRGMLKSVRIVQLDRAEDIVPAYDRARISQGSTILVEYPELYDA